jgi:predicted short-subunit dehydrogenase-like oxidoreductase (DUF2520 family)
MKPSIAIVGCGKVGTTLGLYLLKAGYPLVGVGSKSMASAKKAAGLLGDAPFTDAPWEITPEADVVMITTPDGVIAEACDQIAANDGFREGTIVLHCSGALPSSELVSAKKATAFIGSLHPLQSFAAYPVGPVGDATNPFSGIIAAIEGDPQAVVVARAMAADLGAEAYTIKTEAKTLYHAAAVVASNYLVALIDLAFKLIGAAGIAQKDAFNVLRPLIDGTLANIGRVGIPQALTGPIVRGDTATVKQHVEAIKDQTPDLFDVYQQLGRQTIAVAVAKGDIDQDVADKLATALLGLGK